jgi:flagellar protein FlaF
MSVASYGRVQDQVEDPRRVEMMLLGKVNALMSAADGQGWRERIDASYQNRRVWNTFRTDIVAQDATGAGLPDELKAGLINISLWVDSYCAKLLSQDAPLHPLIAVNEQIIAGLRESIERSRQARTQPADRAAAQAPAAAGPTGRLSA